MKPVYRRVLLKLSGQRLAGDEGWGINTAVISRTEFPMMIGEP